MRINQNISAMNTYSRLTNANTAKSKSLEKLSSGLRINRAGDDAAGLSISEKMRGQISGLNQASRNAQDGISLIQTAEGALSETHAILQRQRELVVQSGSSGTLGAEDRVSIKAEIDELNLELTGIANRTQFNGKNLLNGTYSAQNIQIGANADQALTLTINSGVANEGFSAAHLTVSTLAIDGTSHDADLAKVDVAIAKVSVSRSNLGANQNRLEHTINNLTTSSENLSAAESRIRDVDMAQEMMQFTKNNILSQAATSMLAQANQMPQSVLQLLQ